MHPDGRTLQKMLPMAQGALLIAAAWTLVSVIVQPGPATSIAHELTNDATPATPQTESEIALTDLAVIWNRDLRQVLIEPPPKAAPVAPTTPPEPVDLPALLATFVESDSAWGLFEDSSGTERVRRTGATVDSFEIVSIEDRSARLRKGTRVFEVQIPPAPEENQSPRRRGRS